MPSLYRPPYRLWLLNLALALWFIGLAIMTLRFVWTTMPLPIVEGWIALSGCALLVLERAAARFRR